MQLRPASRKKTKCKCSIAGIAGSGKSYSALKLARGLTDSWEKIAVIDTENSIDKYADRKDLGPFQVINLAEEKDDDRYSPASFCQAIDVCVGAGIEVVIIDSATHVWHWCLERKGQGEEFRAWAKVTPLYNKFVRKIAEAPAHIICCMRRKADYSVVKGERKTKVQKVGLKAEMREGFEYEMDVAFTLDQNYSASVEKDRTSMFVDKPDFVINEKVGVALRNWCEVESKFDATDEKVIKAIHERMKTMGIDEVAGKEFVAKLHGVPTTEARKRLSKFLADNKDVEKPDPEEQPERQPHTFYKDNNTDKNKLWHQLHGIGVSDDKWEMIADELDGTHNSELATKLAQIVDRELKVAQ